jgi:tetratricopeptide (TPR) repeat protein/CHAT domain-containing protein
MIKKYSSLLACACIVLGGCGGPEDERIPSADLLFERAIQYTERGRFDEAATAFENLITVDSDIGRTERVAHHQRYLGIIAEQKGRFSNARSWYDRSIETSRRAASHEGVLNGMLHQASLSRLSGHMREEFANYNSALTYTKFFNYPHGEAIISMKIGEFEAESGRTDIAERHLTHAVYTAAALNDRPLLFKSRLALARNYLRQRNYAGAKTHLDEAWGIQRSVNDPSLRIEHTLLLGGYYNGIGRYSDALKIYEEAWDVHREQPRNDAAFFMLLESLADAYLQHGRYRDAVSYYTILTDLARTHNRQIVHGYGLLGLSDAYLKFGIVMDNNDHLNTALQFAREAEAHFGHIHYFTGQAYAVFQQARGISFLGRVDEAIQLYKNALTFLRETILTERVFPSQERFEQRNNLLNPRTAITQFLVNELVAGRRYDEAFQFAELDRQSMLNEQVLRVGLTSRDSDHAALADSLTRLHRRMQGLDYARLTSYELNRHSHDLRDTLRAEISRARSAIESIQDQLAETLPNSRRLFDKTVPGRRTIQESLPAGRALIAYYPTQTHLHTFMLTRGSYRVHSQELPYEVLRAHVESFQQTITSPLFFTGENTPVDRTVEREYNEKARWIYATFAEPVLPPADGAGHLIFVMPPGMHDIPMHALREPHGRNEYLVTRYRITYLPATTVATFRLQPARRVAGIAAFGNADGSDWDIDYELRDVRGIFRDARLYLDANASIDRLRAERGDILHIATEFYYQPNFPEHSYFRLTQDGSIAVRQIGLGQLAGLHPFPNIILSNSGEIVEGLNVLHPYLLYLNGSRSVAVNHWIREPRSAKWFNENIYSNLAIEYPFIEAFHEAQKTLIATPQYEHPHFWALFFMYSL